MNRPRWSRRQALRSFAGLLAASPCLSGQSAPQLRGEPPGRLTPLDAYANVPEFEPTARRKLDAETFARIAEGDRKALERITFRPRMMVNTAALDLSLELFGQRMFAPLLVGPASRQQRFHPDGELATAQGAAAAKSAIVTAERSGTPFAAAAGAAPGAWRQVRPDADFEALAARIQQAAEAGCRAVFLTLADTGRGPALREGRPWSAGAPVRYGWERLERLRARIGVPLVLKGVMAAAEAREAAERGMDGIVVSNHGAGRAAGLAEPVTVLPGVADAVAGRLPILVDGGFRRGGDVIKAIALGATAALVCRPALWGLAGYGADGVRTVLEMLQTELAQDMVQVGAVNLAAIRRDHIRVHGR